MKKGIRLGRSPLLQSFGSAEPSPRRIQWESAEQQAVVAWARGSRNKYPELRLLYAIPNGHGVHIATRVTMAAEGVEPGIPDLHLDVARGEFQSLYIEMKYGNNDLSPEQQAMHELLKEYGHLVVTCWNYEEAKTVILNYLKGRA